MHPSMTGGKSKERELLERIYAAEKPASKAPDDGLNKLERDFRDRAAEPAFVRGDITGYAREPFKLDIGGHCYFIPDFVAAERPGEHGIAPRITVVEVKGGFFREDAKVKIKVAANKYPFLCFRWLLVYRDGPYGSGWWDVHEVDRRGIGRESVYVPWIHGGVA
jgi:hypothetical protein